MKRWLPWINIAAALIALAVNGLASALPLNGQSTGAISDQFKVFFVPAGYVFAIWGVIYLGWIAFIVYQALPGQRDNPRLHRIGWLFVLSCLANAAWLFAWHYELFPLSVVVMLVLLLSLIAIYVRLNIGRAHTTAIEKMCVDIPFGIYLGWISVATIANVTDLLYFWNWDGFGIAPQVWAVMMLVVASALTLAMAWTRGDVAYLVVIIWSFIGIAIKQSAVPLVANATWAMTALVVLLIPLSIWYRAKKLVVARR
ncbi:MAG: tryptophan-rich sensory protein [Chloroflexi bacterium]|nr:tryptophan-rich sensory protein [Chloroflexota bacterium]